MLRELEFQAIFFLDHIFSWNSESWLGRRRAKNSEVLSARLKRSPVAPLPVKEVFSLTREEFIESCVKTPAPLVVRGGAKDWECIRKWSLEFFDRQYGDTKLLSFEDGQEITVHGLCESIRNKGTSTMKFHPLIDNDQNLQADANWQWLRSMEAGPAQGRLSNLFMTGEGATQMHAANVCNFFVQVTGKKIWWIYPPSVNKWIQPQPRAYHWVSDLVPPPFNPESLLARLPHYKIELEAGDILYNPPYFWHYVFTAEPSIALAYKWVNLFHCLKVSPMMTIAPFFCKFSPIRGLLSQNATHHDHVKVINLLANWRFRPRVNQKAVSK